MTQEQVEINRIRYLTHLMGRPGDTGGIYHSSQASKLCLCVRGVAQMIFNKEWAESRANHFRWDTSEIEVPDLLGLAAEEYLDIERVYMFQTPCLTKRQIVEWLIKDKGWPDILHINNPEIENIGMLVKSAKPIQSNELQTTKNSVF